MLDSWQLNPIVLAHIHRFFTSAQVAVERWSPNDDAFIGGLGTLAGNLLWARSHFETTDPAQERAAATTGAVVSSLADRVVQGQSESARTSALRALGELECELLQGYDAVLTMVLARLREQGLLGATPARVNAAVWTLLFPDFPAAWSQIELVEALVARLQQSA